MTNQITLTIDGVQVRTQPGKTIIQAALEAGLYIPYLCYYPQMKPFGACRMCAIEVEGRRGTPASCTEPAVNGMVVHTKSPVLQDLRKGILELLLSEHPHGCLTCHRIELCGPEDVCLRHVSVNDRCVICPKNERCELKDTVRFVGIDMDTPLAYNNRHLQLEVLDPFYDRDYNLCIVCARCVRVCDEVRGDNAITIIERSGTALVGTSFGTSLLESGCEFCGACVDVCPVGALVERDHKWDKAVQTVNSVCTLCPVGCQVKLEVDRRGRLIRTIGEPDGAANHGQLCFKGKFGMDFVNHRSRLKTPLIRRDGRLQEATWEEALDLVARRLAAYRGSSFAALAGPGATNEDAYLLQKFTRAVMSSSNVDMVSTTSRELVEPLGNALGYWAATGSLWDIERAQAILLVASNVTEGQNVAAVPVKRAVKAGAPLVVIDPREVELTRHARLWLRPQPGTEVYLLGCMLRAMADAGLEDQSFLAQGVDGADAYRSALGRFDLAQVEAVTGVPEGQVREAARLLGTARPAAILYGLETVPAAQREPLVRALVDLALVTGSLGKAGGGLFPLPEGANQQGAWDVGCASYLLPGAAPVSDVGARQRARAASGVKAMLLLGYHPGLASGQLQDYSLDGLEFLVVQDTFLTELGERADVVLPSAAFAERHGTLTNLERRVQRLRPARPAPGEARPDWWAIAQVAHRMGAPGFAYPDVSAVFDEIVQAVPQYAGMSYQRLDNVAGLQWPCPTAEHPGTPLLYAQGFSGGKAYLQGIEYQAPAWNTSGEYPLVWAPGRVLHQPERDLEVVHGDGLNTIRRTEHVQLHPQQASALGLAHGERVQLATSLGRRGPFTVEVVESAPKGVVATTSLFGQLATELQASRDPLKMLKVEGLALVPVRVERAG